MKIEKAPERMSAKERVRRTFEFEKTDPPFRPLTWEKSSFRLRPTGG